MSVFFTFYHGIIFFTRVYIRVKIKTRSILLQIDNDFTRFKARCLLNKRMDKLFCNKYSPISQSVVKYLAFLSVDKNLKRLALPPRLLGISKKAVH
jgi:hypothetical protein